MKWPTRPAFERGSFSSVGAFLVLCLGQKEKMFFLLMEDFIEILIIPFRIAGLKTFYLTQK
jgi:hypothetical protein